MIAPDLHPHRLEVHGNSDRQARQAGRRRRRRPLRGHRRARHRRVHKEPKENAEFFPLTVDYRETTYAAGRIPGGWFKREGRPTEKEILTSRLIDRPMRPLFPKGFNHETQIVAFVLSADGQNDPDILAINGASVALTCSAVPFYSPVGAVRVGRLDGKFVLNPTNAERDKSEIDLIVAGTDDAVVMVEGGRPRGLRADPDRRDPLRARGGPPDRRAPRRSSSAEAGFQKPSWQAPEPYPAERLRRGPPRSGRRR